MANEINGYAVVFGAEAVIAGEFRERIAPGAFDRTLQEHPDVVMILSHDSGRVLGRVSAGTLTVRADRIGLWFSLTPDPTTPEGQTAIGTVGRGDIKGCSFGFRVRAEAWEDGGTRLPLRTITDVDLSELTLTAFPAYDATSAGLLVDNRSAAVRRIAERQAQMERKFRGR